MIIFSGENQDINAILLYHDTSSHALNRYREAIINDDVKDKDYIGFTKNEVMEYFYHHIEELERNVAFSMLAALEASFKIDYQIRIEKKYKDDLSRKFRTVSKNKQNRVALEKDILSLWKSEYPSLKRMISDFIEALNYRNWLAHGRYYSAKLGKDYNVSTIYIISERIYANLPLYKNA